MAAMPLWVWSLHWLVSMWTKVLQGKRLHRQSRQLPLWDQNLPKVPSIQVLLPTEAALFVSKHNGAVSWIENNSCERSFVGRNGILDSNQQGKVETERCYKKFAHGLIATGRKPPASNCSGIHLTLGTVYATVMQAIHAVYCIHHCGATDTHSVLLVSGCQHAVIWTTFGSFQGLRISRTHYGQWMWSVGVLHGCVLETGPYITFSITVDAICTSSW